MSDFEDIGDVSSFEKPTVPSDLVGSIVDLIINTGVNSKEQAEEDLDILIDVMGEEYLRTLAEVLNGDNTSILVDAILQSPALREALTEKMDMFVQLLQQVDFEDSGNL